MSSWLPDWLNSIFGSGDSGESSTVIGHDNNKNEGDGVWTKDLLGSVIKAGTGLAGVYFQQSQNKDIAEQYAQQTAAQIAAEKEANAAKLAAQIKIARMNNLGALYNNWASVTERGGEAGAQAALQTGRNAIDPIATRAAVLK